MAELARLLDPEALDRAEGPRGKMTVVVRPEWLAAGGAMELLVPGRLVCGRCDGGGCDGCSRSGAIRPSTGSGRVQVGLPKGGRAPLVVRLVRPFGPNADLEQLAVEVRVGDEPTPGCRWIASEGRGALPGGGGLGAVVAMAVALALALATAALLASR